MLEPLGLAAGPVVPTREWRELYAALDCAAVAAIHPFYTASFREFGRPGGRSSARRRSATRAPRPGSRPSAGPAASPRERIAAAQNRILPAIKGALAQRPIRAASRCPATRAPSCWSRGCWSRAAPTFATSARPARARAWSDPDREWLEAKGVRVQYRASLEQDLAAVREFRARPGDRHDTGGAEGQGAGDSGAVFHQSHLGAAADGPAGAGSLAQVVNAALGNQARFDAMKAFFDGRRRGLRGRRLGGNAAGSPGVPRTYKAQLAKLAAKRKSEEMV